MQTPDHGDVSPGPGTGAGLTHDDVTRLLDILDRSSFDYLEVEVGGTRLVAGKAGWGPPQALHPQPPVSMGAASPAPRSVSSSRPPAEPASPDAAPGPVSAPTAADGDAGEQLTVTAPIVGVFHRCPQPGVDPYVQVGSVVEADDTLGLIEVMKMFNGVTAGVSGTVVQILAENGEFVEYGQPLVVLEPLQTP